MKTINPQAFDLSKLNMTNTVCVYSVLSPGALLYVQYQGLTSNPVAASFDSTALGHPLNANPIEVTPVQFERMSKLALGVDTYKRGVA